MNLNAEFKAYVAGLNVTDKKMKLTLELDVDIKPTELAAVTQMVSESVMVNLGSPQMVMNFGDESQAKEPVEPAEEPRTKYQTDASGVVVHVFPLPEPKPQETDMFATPGEIKTGDIVDAEYTVVSDNPEQDEDDMPEAAEEYDGEEETEGTELSDKEIEEFILSGQAPRFEDMGFDFPELLRKKKGGTTWTTMAMQLDTSIGKLTRDFKKYKERVAEQMLGGGDTA